MSTAELNRFARACVDQAPQSEDPEGAVELAREALRRAAMREEA